MADHHGNGDTTDRTTDHAVQADSTAAAPAASLPFLKVLLVSAVLGIVVALVFAGFEESMSHVRERLWGDWLGENPSTPVILAISLAGALLVGLGVKYLPGHGGAHPADAHGLAGATDPALASPTVILGVLAVGLVGLMFGAPLGPEGALLPPIAGLVMLTCRMTGMTGTSGDLVRGAGVGALVAAMFGSPVAGAVGLMEMVPTAPGLTTALLVLPAFTASATSVLTLQVIHFHAPGSLPFVYDDFRTVHLVWAIVIGVVAGAAGLLLDRAVHLLRRVTVRIDGRSIVLTALLGGLGIGIGYAIGGPSVRFAGIPEILRPMATATSGWYVLGLAGLRVLITGWAISTGFRGGRIFPSAFVGGAVGLALHLWIPSIPVEVAVGVGLVASMAAAMGTPVMAGLIAASLMPASLMPLAVIGIVAAHTVHVLGDQVAPARP